MSILKKLSILLLLSILITNGLSQSAGTTSFEFLRNQYSPRGAAMGGNLIAVKEDVYTVVHKPGILLGNQVGDQYN